MKPTISQVFYAYYLYIWDFAFTAVTVIVAGRAMEPTWAALADWHYTIRFLAGLFLATLIGYLGSGVVGALLLPGFDLNQLIRNGGPFRRGDSVVILFGPHKGKTAKVTSFGQGTSLCLRIEGESIEEYEIDELRVVKRKRAEGKTEADSH